MKWTEKATSMAVQGYMSTDVHTYVMAVRSDGLYPYAQHLHDAVRVADHLLRLTQ